MIDPMVKAIAASISDRNGWSFTTGTTADGKEIEYLSFKIKGVHFFIDEGCSLKVFPRSALANKMCQEIQIYLGQTNKKDMSTLIKMLDDIYNKEKHSC